MGKKPPRNKVIIYGVVTDKWTSKFGMKGITILTKVGKNNVKNERKIIRGKRKKLPKYNHICSKKVSGL